MSAIDMVETAGCEAIEASSADEAVGILEARADIRAVFTDIQMPGSMDGLGLVRVLKVRWPCVAVLVASGKTSSFTARDDLLDDVPFLLKPYLPHQIRAALCQLIG